MKKKTIVEALKDLQTAAENVEAMILSNDGEVLFNYENQITMNNLADAIILADEITDKYEFEAYGEEAEETSCDCGDECDECTCEEESEEPEFPFAKGDKVTIIADKFDNPPHGLEIGSNHYVARVEHDEGDTPDSAYSQQDYQLLGGIWVAEDEIEHYIPCADRKCDYMCGVRPSRPLN
jgi:hypothetical protein